MKNFGFLLLVPLVCIGGCAAREKVPDGEPQARSGQALGSHRVMLVNQTSAPLRYRYTRYSPPAAQSPIVRDLHADPQLAGSLNISFSFDELAPGATVLLDAIPGTNLSLHYLRAGSEQQVERTLDAPMRLQVSEQGVVQDGLPGP
ncbi:MAG: hypothetical protein CVV27_04170 [Candidatus Melainabacteria bacterium HGW-Melainabacteria-1]|nr:MAG: hypothetical protein CVV27_04170 [Candidatus Melainabacteria bacterium HGW-Melainabacteria-1]